jgi:micrococcal nuclease
MKARVDEVIDGDTFRANDEMLVRLLGINTPEKEGPYREEQFFHEEATTYLEELLTGEFVWLEFDKERRDSYGRVLAYVFHEGYFINAEMIRQGYARTCSVKPNTRFSSFFEELERRAKKEKLGIWKK